MKPAQPEAGSAFASFNQVLLGSRNPRCSSVPMAMPVKRAGASVETVEAEFHIENFAAAAAMTRTFSQGKKDFREFTSGPIVKVRDLDFAVAVVWAVRENSKIDMNSNIGAYIHRVGQSIETVYSTLQIELVNRDAGVSRVRHNRSKFEAWQQYFGWAPSFGNGNDLGLPLTEVFDDSNGWLHDGGLRVRVKLSIAFPISTSWVGSAPARASSLATELKAIVQLLT